MSPILRHRQVSSSGSDDEHTSDELVLSSGAILPQRTTCRSKRGNLRSWTDRQYSRPVRLFAYAAGFLIPPTAILLYWNVEGSQRLISSLPPYVEVSLTERYHHNGSVVPVVLPSTRFISDINTGIHPAPKRNGRNASKRRPDYGGIDYQSAQKISSNTFARIISSKENEKMSERVRPSKGKFYIDDSRYLHYDEIDYPKESGCYTPTWAFEVYPNCNLFHELPLERAVSAEESRNVTYLGRGHFRAGWSVVNANGDGSSKHHPHDHLVLKTIRLREDKDTITTTGIAMTQTEANTMLATAGSNRTTNIYGHCSTSVMVETGKPFRRNIIESWGWKDQDELDRQQVDDVQPFNDYTPEEKLQMALHMAEALADLHGNPGGVIVNHDISLDQVR